MTNNEQPVVPLWTDGRNWCC